MAELTLANYVNQEVFYPTLYKRLLCKREQYGKSFYCSMGGKMYAEHSSLTENGLIIRDESGMTYILRFKMYQKL
jgi:hypothetical protein